MSLSNGYHTRYEFHKAVSVPLFRGFRARFFLDPIFRSESPEEEEAIPDPLLACWSGIPFFLRGAPLIVLFYRPFLE